MANSAGVGPCRLSATAPTRRTPSWSSSPPSSAFPKLLFFFFAFIAHTSYSPNQPRPDAPFRPAIVRSTREKRENLISTLLVFACALEHIHDGQDIPVLWGWTDERVEYWRRYTSLLPPQDPVWASIRTFRDSLEGPVATQLDAMTDLVWELVKQPTSARMGAWDTIIERFIIARFIDPRSIRHGRPLLHRPCTMATFGSELTWVMRAPVPLLIGREQRNVTDPDTPFAPLT